MRTEALEILEELKQHREYLHQTSLPELFAK